MTKFFRTLAALGLILAACGAPRLASAQIGVSVTIAPPALPVYEQPLIPGPGYLWTPGYWAWADGGYYWVPGTWVQPPEVGVLWTPGYWGWFGGSYLFHEGYWGPHIGFYGGINYGFGYTGSGYFGGYWDHGEFAYNRAVNNVNVTSIHNVYNTTVVNNNVTRVSYNGGSGGVPVQPTAAERQIAAEPHTPATALQSQHVAAARSNPQLYASANNGRPPIAATAHAAALTGAGVIAARAAGAAVANHVARPPGAGEARPAGAAVARPPNTAVAHAPTTAESRAPTAAVARPPSAPHTAAPVRAEAAPRAPAAPRAEAAPRAPAAPVRAEAAPRPAPQPQPQQHAAAAPHGGGGHEEHR